MNIATHAISRREAGKLERRQRIVEAAAALVKKQGYNALSMIQIAERAEVSPATLYNLFKTKGAIFQQVFDGELNTFQRLANENTTESALDRIFSAINIAASMYHRNPKFYRAMDSAFRDKAEQLGAAIGRPRQTFWQDLIAATIEDGSLRENSDPILLGIMVAELMRGIFLSWASRTISSKRLAAESCYGVAIVLYAWATPKAASRLKTRFEGLQKALAARDRFDRSFDPATP